MNITRPTAVNVGNSSRLPRYRRPADDTAWVVLQPCCLFRRFTKQPSQDLIQALPLQVITVGPGDPKIPFAKITAIPYTQSGTAAVGSPHDKYPSGIRGCRGLTDIYLTLECYTRSYRPNEGAARSPGSIWNRSLLAPKDHLPSTIKLE